MNPFFFNEENTFCISLLSKPERWERMQTRFKTLGINASRWPAATVSDLKDPFYYALNDGQKGCAQSHINIWRHIVENKIEYALILEDDACFDKKWKEKLDEFCRQNTDKEWHMIFLNASEPIDPKDTWVKASEQYLTAGYVISLASAEIILRDFGNCFFSSDWMTSRDQIYGHSYCYFPWLIIQEGIDSTIGSNLDADREKVVRCLNEINYSLDNYI
jgi:glycosyl transferase family 25